MYSWSLLGGANQMIIGHIHIYDDAGTHKKTHARTDPNTPNTFSPLAHRCIDTHRERCVIHLAYSASSCSQDANMP